MSNNSDSAHAPFSLLAGVSLFLFGCYLSTGAYVAWRDTKWPIFMPAQLDIFGFLFSAFGDGGAILGAILLAFLGGFCILLPVLVLFKRSRQKYSERHEASTDEPARADA